ncbi:MAG TPA: glycine cleavage system aminomethyltransferase GcvT, partial [Nitrospiria bacterium]|nr:glycine cleavage system aminomethyltransferase GcvT [Nitrospiria bacterium]
SAQYTLISRPSGGIIDDIIIWRGEKDRYMLCVNAANREKVIDLIMENGTRFEFEIKDITDNTGMISLQGPMSASVLERAMSGPASAFKPWRFKEVKFGGVPCLVSMTGYTGEVGYEIIMDGSRSQEVWEILLDSGREFGIKPCGLGARDTLRLEMGYSLYGNDIDDNTTPVEAGLEWVVDFSKDDFIGKAALLEQKKNGPKRRLIFFELLQKGVPRKGFKIFSDGKEIGVVTSGNISPMLNKGIGIGYVLPEYAKPGIEVLVDIRGRVVPAIIVRRPFYLRK